MPALWLATWLRLSPAASAVWAAAATGQGPEVGERLVGVCYRESRCRPLRRHDLDQHIGPIAWGGQAQLHRRGRKQGRKDPGHIDPDCQPLESETWLRWDWSTRGAFGLQAASHWPYLPRCYSPLLLDQPAVSALVAARKWRKKCRGDSRRGWCRARRRRAEPGFTRARR